MEAAEMLKKQARGFTRGAFAVALGLLYILVLRSIAVQITPPPENRSEPYPDVSTQELCEAEGGRWIENTGQLNSEAPRAVTIDGEKSQFCQGPLAFERERTNQSEASQQTSLFVFALGGGIAVALSLLVRVLQPVSPGLMLGGIVSFFIAGIHVWTLSPGIGRLITIIAIFAILVWIGLFAFKEPAKKKKK